MELVPLESADQLNSARKTSALREEEAGRAWTVLLP